MWLGGAEAEAGVPRAASTLCNLYHEAGQRLRRLQDQLSARDALIARLRARLAAQEAEAAPSLVDALLEQVARYREQLRRQEGGASEEVVALRQEIERLKEQLEEKDSEVQMLMEPLCPQEADIALQARARATSNVLCRSLASEAHQLRRTLAATAHMCQQLAQCLEERQRANGGTETPKEPEGTSRDTADQAEVDKLREENQQLKAKITHVEDLNAKWQRYDASRDEYVRGLQAQLRELQAPRQTEGPSAPAALLQKEISRLNQQLEETLGDCAEARRELAAAQEARDAALERVQMLEQQILVYKDDFSSERADRERAQSRFQELWDTVACMQCQVPRRQEPWEPGRTRLRSSAAQCLETDTLEPAVPRSQKLGSPWPKPPAEGGCPGQGSQGDLQCPHCQQHFSDEQGEELLRHMAECCQ